MAKSKTRCIGLITSGGDSPGLNAAIRGVAKAAMDEYGIKIVGILDGFRGLVENRTIALDGAAVSGILTLGGTILGTSRDKPHKMPMGGQIMDMTATAVENARRMQLDCLVCLGGGGTQKNALHLHQHGLNVLTLPKTIDNDVAETEATFGFDTAIHVAAEAIDRLHSTATSHHRIIVCEIMGHNAGWLPLAAGIAGGADVILIPEIPYDLDIVAHHLIERRRRGKRFSIIAVAEGAISREEAKHRAAAAAQAREVDKAKAKDKKDASEKTGSKKKEKNKKANPETPASPDRERVLETPHGMVHLVQESTASRIARQLQQMTGSDARVTSLGHVVRGGSPSATDRLLCTRLGTKAAQLLAEGHYNVMVAIKGNLCVPVPLEKVAGHRKQVPVDHEWITAARLCGTCMGDR